MLMTWHSVIMSRTAAGEGDVELLGMLLRAGINPDVGVRHGVAKGSAIK